MGAIQSMHGKSVSTHEEELICLYIQIISAYTHCRCHDDSFHPHNIEDGRDPFKLLYGSTVFYCYIPYGQWIPELAMTVNRLLVFYKRRDLYLYPAWAYSIPASVLKIPLSLIECLIWTFLIYSIIGYNPEIGRFFV